ncbi:serine hydrolase domain-containing protein [Aquimarina sp. 2201CG5-10]|uniref:serine hydrolase domain-containing protein n=1 Tax=Aquimarina callyspongiae TaxID=3098150 RepID=UPI002AB504D8|nr:serine hydrolase domain-containing protein [Aquimarina sp. 2201CG5-10]MDY8134271.1 serine hydrolase domain-containing protein [Aquimarina sp. 2201CG5-10]
MKKSFQKLSVLLLTLISLTNCHSQHKIKNFKGVDVSTDSISIFLKSRMDSLNIPGLSIAVINDSKVVYHQTFGYANLEKKMPVTSKTIFEGASMSKSVFASFVMKYVEERKLDLDKPLYEYLPYQEIAYDERYKKITARMVLSHRSGFPNWRENEDDKKLKIKFQPDTDYEYSGEGYQYLAMVLKHIDNTDWKGLEAIFQDKIAKPLKMKHTVFVPTSYTNKHKAEPYNNQREWIDLKNNYWYKKEKGKFIAPSSIHSEPLDFSKWMIGIMNNKLLSKESYIELLKHHSKVSTLSSGTNVYYTLGFVTADKPYNTTFFHGGSNDGFTCWYLLDTTKKWGYVLFTNSENGEKLGNEVWDYFEKE